MTLVDTNVLLDVFTDDSDWSIWSQAQLDRLGSLDRLIINDIVYAELSVSFSSPDELDGTLARMMITLAPIDRSALFLAGRAFQLYRRAGGTRTGVLPDFFIGAHAAVEGIALLTRDPRRYLTYFSNVILIAP
jgi:predicted nucleic acid-binding protein